MPSALQLSSFHIYPALFLVDLAARYLTLVSDSFSQRLLKFTKFWDLRPLRHLIIVMSWRKDKKIMSKHRVSYCVRPVLHSCNVLFVPLIFCNSVSVWKSGLTRLTIACCIHMCLLVQVSQSHTTSQATNPGEAKWLHWMASCVGIIIVMLLVYSPRPWVTSAHNSVTLHTEGESFCQNTSHRLICFASSNNETYLGIPILEYN